MKPYKIIASSIIALLLFGLFLSFENNSLTSTNLELESSDIPKSFDDFKIVQVSDLHGKFFGKNQGRLVDLIRRSDPDMIAVTGDLIESNNYDEEASMVLLRQIVKIAPVYFVTGNHEWWSGMYEQFENKLKKIGVTVLRDDHIAINRGRDRIVIIGIDDPASVREPYGDGGAVKAQLDRATRSIDKGSFKILLAHRPELFHIYRQYDIDVILSGHAHGGQFRPPFTDGVISPDQGLFPEYTAGMYKEDGSALVVNRGLGSSVIPQRLFNRPEIVILTLKR